MICVINHTNAHNADFLVATEVARRYGKYSDVMNNNPEREGKSSVTVSLSTLYV